MWSISKYITYSVLHWVCLSPRNNYHLLNSSTGNNIVFQGTLNLCKYLSYNCFFPFIIRTVKINYALCTFNCSWKLTGFYILKVIWFTLRQCENPTHHFSPYIIFNTMKPHVCEAGIGYPRTTAQDSLSQSDSDCEDSHASIHHMKVWMNIKTKPDIQKPKRGLATNFNSY